MKKVFIVIAIILTVVILAVGGVLSYINAAYPNVGEASELKIELTPERIERGKYLANAVTVCMDCHSTRDWSKFSGPITPGTIGKGGERFDASMGFPGVYFSKNVTPSGIDRYTDGELFRVITTGVNKDGKAMFPVMPYPYYGKMDEEDIYSIIAYLRTLDPIENSVPDSESDFPMNFILKTIPAKGKPMKRPEPGNKIAYGAYVINAAACRECHSPVNQGQVIEDLAFSGGREFNMPDGSTLRTSNLTPDNETGIGSWTEKQFIQRFKIYADSAYVAPPVAPGEFNSIMPWTMYSRMTEEDLSAIYAYLHNLKPVSNTVVKFTAGKKE